MALSVNTRRISGVVIVDVSGELSHADSIRLFRETVNPVLEEGAVKLLLNLSEVSYINSAGLGTIFTVNNSIRKSKGQLGLLNPSEKVKELLEVTKLSRVFHTFDDETKAIQALVGRVAAKTSSHGHRSGTGQTR